jgi:hypothetical protein
MAKFSVVVIDSRSDKHPDWVLTCINSIKSQIVPVELIVINNIGRKKTIGKCWNEGVRKTKGDWVLFVGDDDFIARDYIQVMNNYTNIDNKKVVSITTYMTPFDNNSQKSNTLARQCTGAFQKEYLLKHPFNEKLQRAVDREYLEELVKRGDLYVIIRYYHGYFYRKHDDYSCAGKIYFEYKPKKYYFIASNQQFLTPITDHLNPENYNVTDKFVPLLADNVELIWVEWANDYAINVSKYETKAKKILRIHAFEAYSNVLPYVDFNGYDLIIFVAEHIKKYVESKYGEISHSVVIPNAIDTDKFSIPLNKEKNNKIAYAGYVTRKKGIGELLLIAKSLPEYEFHIAGKYQEDDVAQYMNEKKPENVFLHPWQQDLNKWFEDKTYIISTSLRESQGVATMEAMASGLKPLIYSWIGAKDIYKNYVFENIDELKNLLNGEVIPELYRNMIVSNYKDTGIMDVLKPIKKELYIENI